MASGWNLWVWLECLGVVSGCFCKEVYRYPHNVTYPDPYSICVNSFFAAVSLLLCSFKKCFSVLVYVILCNIANVPQRTFEMIQKSRSRGHGDMIISARMCARESRNFHVRGTE